MRLEGRSSPVFGLSNPDIVCGSSAFPIRHPAIQTATIVAGSDASFELSGPWFEGEDRPYIYHDGPGQVFLSKLPEGLKDLSAYDASGDFFKIAYAGPADDAQWSLNGTYGMNFMVPRTTPPGKYVLRIEQFLASATKGDSQWFVSCAYVEVVGSGGGAPGPFVRFPNAYKEDDPSECSGFAGYNEES
ncbi:glycoside hydrolase [Massariosphaeria phaeospora]|uniref:lytic cellulose monooxygenase (C4-dehydrogenating) n=1 Tax=Massariosphaeria phaeospora TaxID=100035 RepID=A0A7C8ICL5_9PLEO|nr:glycoside hydrolase [Massariosphaeria phaeospora]